MSTMFRPDGVSSQLSRLLASPAFDASARNRRFLEFVVRQTIEGRADRIKAYTIATEVFHRGADFDPQLDSIVRIEAGRLRRSLEHYYLTAGANDPVVINIPKGAYVPKFARRGTCASAPAAPAAITSHHGRVILVRSFDEEGDQSTYSCFTRGLTRQLIVGLTRFTDLFVLGDETSSKLDETQHPIPRVGADFILAGTTIFYGVFLRVEALLMDAATGRYLWADQYDRPLKALEIIHIRDEIANKVIRSIGKPHGAIFRSRARAMEGKPARSLSDFPDRINGIHTRQIT